ncbi:membrane-spanning 4-domains subfamily A member 4A [Scleropages formosus]|uniref:membrane-spanning 4-domains subfamily A member 4A n=1 Tax=Scleropages formosus TaxID=113540 RepID=UPI0008789EC4|nr:membrane-spanning 4-domains subfamily A member 4A-like [Scleropages formosus]
MSTSISKVNGLVVVTHIFPQGEESKDSIAMTSAPCKMERALNAEPEGQVPVVAMTKQFLRGQPIPLGTVQICIGFVTMAIGLVGILTFFHGLIPVIAGATFVISGVVTVASHKGNSASLIKGTLAMNLLSVVMAVAGVVFFCMMLSESPHIIECPDIYRYSSSSWECRELSWQKMQFLYGINGLLLVMSVLEACVALSLCVFSCMAIHQASSSQQVVVIEKGLAESASISGSDVALLGSEGDLGSAPTCVA